MKSKSKKIKYCVKCNKFLFKNKWGKNKDFDEQSIEKTVCPKCSKQGSKYFEGILQARNIDKEIKEFIESQVIKQHNKGVFITKKVNQKNGIDYYLSSKKFLASISKKLIASFGGIIKSNAKLFSRNKQTSKDIFRVNVLYQAPEFKKHDIIKINNHLLKITNISKKISGIDLKTGKKASFIYKKSNPIKLEKHKTIVSKIKPHIEVLDPITYQSTKVENKAKVKPNQKVSVVIDKGIFII